MKFTSLPIALILFTAGCASQMGTEKEWAFLGGRYGELEKLAEAGVTDLATAKTSKLYPLCVSYSKLKRYNKLFPCLDQMEANIRKGDKNYVDEEERQKASAFWHGFAKWAGVFEQDATPWLHLMRAEASIELGDYKRAVEDAKQMRQWVPSVQKRGLEGWARIESLTMSGLAHGLSGDRNSALKYAGDLERISTGWLASPPYSGQGPQKYTGLAKIYIALGEFEKALGFIRQSDPPAMIQAIGSLIFLAASEESLFTWTDLPRLFVFSKSLFETGHVKEAKEGYDRLLQMPQTKVNGEIYWLILFDRGRIAEKEGNLKEAIEFYRQAVDVIEQQRSSINTEASKIGFVGDKQSVYRRLISALFAERQYGPAFEYVERSKSRALVDLLASKQDFAVQSGNTEQVRALLAMAETAEVEARVQGEKRDGSQTRSLLGQARQQLRDQSPELASLVSVTYLTAAQIQSRVPPDEALIEYYYNDKEMFAFVLTAQGLQAMRLSSENLEADIRQFRKALEEATSDRHIELSQRLYQRLLRPLEGLLTQRNLIIVAHGALHYLPFNALHNGTERVIERYSIRMLPSASLLQYLRTQKPDSPGGLLAFGNPDLGDPRYNLRHAQREAVAITQTFPQSKALLQNQATETAFKQFGRGFKYIHFASHGEFDSEAPLKSALLLAKDAQNDGALTVGELYSLSLDADLVTLSACETGLGKISNGDDVVGLTRGFLYAGSRSIIASLWKVDDLSTSQLMTQFYSNLQQSNKREALRQAQLEIQKKYPHPFFWAAFQLTGNAQ